MIAYSPMGSGLLTGAMTRERAAGLAADDWRSKSAEFQEPKLSQNLALAERVKAVAERRKVSAGAVAAAWTLQNPAVTGAIIGARNTRQVEEVSSCRFTLDPEELAEIQADLPVRVNLQSIVPLRILFVPFGSEGDVNPLLWLASGMVARGHESSFLITPHYAPLVEERGYRWIPVGTNDDFLRFARDPRVWSRIQGPRMVLKGMLATLPAYRDAMATASRNFDLVVLSSLALGAASMAEAADRPRLTLHMQPALLRSIYECPVFMEELAWLRGAPRSIKRLFFALVDMLFWEPARKRLNRFRREEALPEIRNFFNDALHGAEGVAALFPRWFAPPQPDWPSRVRQFGFPVAHDPRPLSESLERFLSSGEPPVVWTHGSANFDIRHFQMRALEVSRKLNLRCLLISLDPPASLGHTAFHVAHARFEDVFPRCRAVVHHGGIGTMAKCIAAAVPQLIIHVRMTNPIMQTELSDWVSEERFHIAGWTRASLPQPCGSFSNQRSFRAGARIPGASRRDRPLSDVSDWAEQIAAEPSDPARHE